MIATVYFDFEVVQGINHEGINKDSPRFFSQLAGPNPLIVWYLILDERKYSLQYS